MPCHCRQVVPLLLCSLSCTSFHRGPKHCCPPLLADQLRSRDQIKAIRPTHSSQTHSWSHRPNITVQVLHQPRGQAVASTGASYLDNTGFVVPLQLCPLQGLQSRSLRDFTRSTNRSLRDADHHEPMQKLEGLLGGHCGSCHFWNHSIRSIS